MADKLTSTRTLGVGMEYTKLDDGTNKTVYLKVSNPKNDLTEIGIKGIMELLIGSGTGNPVLKTPDNQLFSGKDAVITAYIETEERVDFDIGVES